MPVRDLSGRFSVLEYLSINAWVVLLPLVLLTSCTRVSPLLRQQEIAGRTGAVRVLLMPAEIELAELTAGGLTEPRADWTAAAKQQVIGALQEELSRRNAILVVYEPPTDPEKAYRHDQLVKLHKAVGSTIVQHKYGGRELELPTKEGRFDWTLGPGVGILRQEYQAEYALFILIRDTYASAGRVLLSLVLTGLALFPIPPGSVQQGFASLVDLGDGRILWFNRLLSYTGDLRDAEGARETISALLADLPL